MSVCKGIKLTIKILTFEIQSVTLATKLLSEVKPPTDAIDIL